MPRKKKQRQTRLTFEPVGSSDSPGKASPANVRFTKGVAASGGSSSRASSQQAISTPGRPGPSQKAASPVKLSHASFMPKPQGSKRPIAGNSSANDSANDSAGEVEEEGAFPKSSQSISTMLRQTGFGAGDVVGVDDGDDDDDDEPIIPASTRKRSRPKFIELEDSSDGAASPAKKSKTSQITSSRSKKPTPSVSPPVQRHPPKSHRTEKQKKIELLRRRRAGEKIDRVTSSEDSEEEKRGIYDSDSEAEFGVLKEFDDEEEPDKEEVEVPARQISKKTEKSAKDGQKGSEDEGDDDDLDDFVVDDDDAPLGAPANLGIPLEFTAQAHKPLKDQFPYAIEWLVHNRINPAFDRNDPVYTNAWRKLNDEVQGLASSKFASSAWKPEFHKALKGRPNMVAESMNYDERRLHEVCEACGRSKHQSTRAITFSGHPYYKDTLGEVESESTSDSEDCEGDASDNESIDSQGMTLPAATRKWHVGIVCCTNAETAHSLIHWKHALKEWVEERLQIEGWMKANKLAERERMGDGKRRKLANSIVDGWREKKIIASLYRDFKATLEDARNKSTTGWHLFYD
ncbi:uncharacterized protein F4807DRAFT_447612 [Annulohypoxylon truncatum]|uniref:uncharacterized protein n=1 Tax=Annulohypoxylon truncatum TaxID=327061 RepID=UPI00200851FA|nr:uncharacterized protein F4807DRAFT_447612 [Annulohypoxylon truncatum]KAI1204396.1 hypothetical protein F4807DRAFT_447612 [Annulohypoxylon truncatum]